MEKEDQRNLVILNEIANGSGVTQRSLAQRGGIALGLTNLYLKRLVHKGYIKISNIPTSRIKYLLTPKGIVEKSRLTYEYMNYSLHLYRQARQTIRDAIKPFLFQKNKRIALYGINEATELAFLTLREFGMEPSLVIGEKGNQETFLGIPVRPLSEIVSADYDLIIVPRFGLSEEEITFLNNQHIPEEKIMTF